MGLPINIHIGLHVEMEHGLPRPRRYIGAWETGKMIMSLFQIYACHWIWYEDIGIVTSVRIACNLGAMKLTEELLEAIHICTRSKHLRFTSFPFLDFSWLCQSRLQRR